MSFVTVTNAPSVASLHGMGYQPGGIISGGLGGGFDFNIIPNTGGGEDYFGCTLSGGAATSDMHIFMGYTIPIVSIPAEVIDIINDAYHTMMWS